MPFYHATTRDRLPSIERLGLLPTIAEQNFDCERGVYLAGSATLAIMFVIEAYTGKKQTTKAPKDVVESIRVIVVDDSRIDRKLLQQDPHVEDGWQSWIYPKPVDVTNCAIVTVDDCLASNGEHDGRN